MSPSYLSLLEALRSHYQLPAFPEPLPSTQFHLELGSGLVVTIDWHPKTELVELFSTLGTYDPKQELAVLKTLIQGNFLWAATGGGTLSAQPDTQTVYLAYQTPILLFKDNKEEDFVSLVEKFAAAATSWAIILQELSKESEADL